MAELTNKTRLLIYQGYECPGLEQYLQAKGFEVTYFVGTQFTEIQKALQTKNFDICILDAVPTYEDRHSLVPLVRKIDSSMPILFLALESSQKDIINGFIAGVDDYVVRPFNMDILICRVNAILRRSNTVRKMIVTKYKLGNIDFDVNDKTLSYGEKIQVLSKKETMLLQILCSYNGAPVPRDVCLKEAWEGDVSYFAARSMDVYINKLRKLLAVEPRVKIINCHGFGYALRIFED